MVRFERRVRVRPGAFHDAVEWAKEIASYINGKHLVGVRVYTEKYSDVGILCWSIDGKSVAEVDSLLDAITGDEIYWQAVLKGADYLVPGTTRDVLLQEL